MDHLLEMTQAALARAGQNPVERFSAVVDAHVRFHCERAEESFVGNTELRSLSAPALRRVLSKRDRQQHTFDDVVLPDVAAGVFVVTEPELASRAIVTMCTSVAFWYQRTGPLSPDDIVRTYRELALNTLGFSERALQRGEVRPLKRRPSLKVPGEEATD